MQEWYQYVGVMAEKYKVDKYLCLALAETESSKWGNRVNFGWISKTYCGPFGIHKCFSGPPWYWDIADWKVNTEVGIKALSNHLRRANGNLHKALKKYNTGDRGAKFERYVKRIKNLQAKYKRENEPIKISKNSTN